MREEEPKVERKKQKSEDERLWTLAMTWKVKLFKFLFAVPAITSKEDLYAELKKMSDVPEDDWLPLLTAIRKTFITPHRGQWVKACDTMLMQWAIKPTDVKDEHKQHIGRLLEWLDRWFEDFESYLKE